MKEKFLLFDIQSGISGDMAVAALLDLLLYATKGIAMYAHRARRMEEKDSQIDRFVLKSLFSTITNVNFDPERIREMILEAARLRDRARNIYRQTCEKKGKTAELPEGPATWEPAKDMDNLLRQGEEIAITRRMEKLGPDVTGLQELLTYGLKGMGAYAYHAMELGKEEERVYAFIHEALNLIAEESADIDELLAACLKCGEVNLKTLELLDLANTDAYGHPVPTKVRLELVKGKAVLVSGHDLLDLEELLKQTEGRGINVYTHGEMLPAHGYPGLKKHKHL